MLFDYHHALARPFGEPQQVAHQKSRGSAVCELDHNHATECHWGVSCPHLRRLGVGSLDVSVEEGFDQRDEDLHSQDWWTESEDRHCLAVSWVDFLGGCDCDTRLEWSFGLRLTRISFACYGWVGLHFDHRDQDDLLHLAAPVADRHSLMGVCCVHRAHYLADGLRRRLAEVLTLCFDRWS